METRHYHAGLVVGIVTILAACSGSDSDSDQGAGTGGLGGTPAGTGGLAATGGTPAAGGNSTTGGTSASGGTPATGGTPTTGGTPATGGTTGEVPTEPFSFFVTSLEAMRRLSGSQDGFGGDLRYGEANGLAGADKICSEIAESSMPGAAAKQWRAFLSVESGPDGQPVNAIDRIGSGPWYDRLGRIVAQDTAGLLDTRPDADPAIVNDLPNELGEPNHSAGGEELDNHDVMTGSDENGELTGSTCDDWTSTSSESTGGRPFGGGGPTCGHSWPAQSGQNWISAHAAPGCAASVVVGEGSFGGGGVGDMGGYGAIYCFALSP